MTTLMSTHSLQMSVGHLPYLITSNSAFAQATDSA